MNNLERENAILFGSLMATLNGYDASPRNIKTKWDDEIIEIPKRRYTMMRYDSPHTTKKPFPRDEEWEEGITN